MRLSRRILKRIVVYVIAVGCLAWVLYGVRFDELLRQMRDLHLWWIAPALALDVLSTVCHGLRWQLLLRPTGHLTTLRTVQAIYAGLFTSEILPLRAGEVVRGYLASRWMGVPFATVLPSMITERVIDGTVLVFGLGVSALFISLPPKIASAGMIVGAAMLVAVVVLVILAFTMRDPSATDTTGAAKRSGPVQRIAAFLSRFARGLRAVWTSPHFLPALAVSLLFLSLQALSFWMIMKAYGLHVSLWVPAVVLIVVRLGTAVPSAPANIGPYQLFCVLTLTLFGIEKTTATGFAIVLSIVLAVPLLTLGLFAFAKSGLTVSEVRKQARTRRA
jgi:uncharacterized protein (TIRG00374 family)